MGEVIAFPGQPYPDEVRAEEPEEFDLDMTLLNVAAVAEDLQEVEHGDLVSLLDEMERLTSLIRDYLNAPT